MKTSFLLFLGFFAFITLPAQDWKIAGNSIRTTWGEQLKPDLPLPEYPRPQMIRENWLNLNGSWEYAIRYKDEKKPDVYTGQNTGSICDRISTFRCR